MIGQYIKEKRKEKGLSARELARRSGVSQPYLSQLENEKFDNPTTEVLTKIANGLNIPFEELISKAYIKVHVGYADEMEKQFGIKIQKQNEEEKPAIFAGDDILFNIKSNPNVSLNFKPLKQEDRKRMEDLLKAAFPEYFK